MRILLVIGALSCLIATQVRAAEEVDLHQLARTLGAMLGSEVACGISFAPEKVQAFIRAKVPADDIEFTDRMSTIASNTAYGFNDMSAGLKAAHCEQMRRLSTEFDLVK